jgi:8-oxo-dGTP pyrophosphatase MutT (NUDIX family)
MSERPTAPTSERPAAPPEPKPSGTVVAVRDARDGLEVLLLERAGRAGEPGPHAWVFPGGKVEPGDLERGGTDPAAAARFAAVREAREEAGLVLAPERLVPISRWITPELTQKRFDTWFFLACVTREALVRVDGAEIGSHRWLAPARALEAHAADELRLAPPTFVTVTWLVAHRDAQAAAAALGDAPLVTFRPRIHRVEGGACILYPGDAGYETGTVEHAGPRHRLWSDGKTFRYERSRD